MEEELIPTNPLAKEEQKVKRNSKISDLASTKMLWEINMEMVKMATIFIVKMDIKVGDDD